MFLPDLMTEALTDLTPELLHSRGIQLLMMDFDNTIVPYTTSEPTAYMKYWLECMKLSDIKICVVSNSKKPRVREFCARFGIDCITHARKPFHRGIKACLKKYGMEKKACALVGDQIYTDTLGAKTSGIQAILVEAIHNHNFWLKLRHVAELPFIYLAKKRKLS